MSSQRSGPCHGSSSAPYGVAQVLRGDLDTMNASTRWQWMYRLARWRTLRPAALLACCGAILGLVTIIVSASKVVDARTAIALALPAIVMTIGGLIGSLVPDAWTAWRRGFKQGCRVGLMLQRDGLYPGSTGTPSTPPRPRGQHGLPPTAT